MENDAIVALSTPPGESGIAVVRISGSSAVRILDDMAPGARLAPSAPSPSSRSTTARRRADRRSARRQSCAPPRATRGKTWWRSPATEACGSSPDLLDEITRLGARPPLPANSRKERSSTEEWTSRRRRRSPISFRRRRSFQRKIALEQLGERFRARCARSRKRSSRSSPSSRRRSISPKRSAGARPRETLDVARKARAAIAGSSNPKSPEKAPPRPSRDDPRGPQRREEQSLTTRSSARNGRSSPRRRNDETCFARGSTSAASRAASRIRPASPKRAARSRRRESKIASGGARGGSRFCSSWTEAAGSRTKPPTKSRGSLRTSFSARSTRAISGCDTRLTRRAGSSARGRDRRLGAHARGLEESAGLDIRESGEARRERGLDRERIAVNARQAAALREADEALARSPPRSRPGRRPRFSASRRGH